MLSERQIKVLRYAARGAIVLFCFLLAGYGYLLEKEDPLQDDERIKLYNQAFANGTITINQPAPGAPLEAHIPEFRELERADQDRYGEDVWRRMRRQTFRFVAAVNQGLGDPFEYVETEDGRAAVEKIKESALRYRNPFEGTRPGPVITPINSSEVVARSRPGWRIVSRDLALYLRPGSEPQTVDVGAQFTSKVGGEFILASRGGPGVTLRISGEGQGNLQTLRLEPRGVQRAGGPVQLTRRHGEYFVWDGRAFAVYRTNAQVGDAADPAIGDLVFTKMINGRPLRVQVLGRATANLIGSPVGGETSYIDGAFLHNKARRLVLTIDPEIQSAAYYLLYTGLRKLDAERPARLTRPRKGAITVLDADTGQILAHAGAPGYDPLWQSGRVVLANRQRIIENPANELHMPGSAIKVLTSGMGYLMFGDGSGGMLPTSINKLAIRQAFRNTYGGPMPPENILDNTGLANPTEAGERYFQSNGRPERVRDEFVRVLNSAFYVLHYTPPEERYRSGDEAVRRELYDPIVSGDLESYFDASAMYSFFPVRSRFPARDADSLERFRQYAIGGSEARFTTMRLAAILGTVSTGHPMRPFIVESVFDSTVQANGNRVTNARANVFPDLRAVLPDVEGAQNGNDRQMIGEMRRFLELVCSPGGGHTGWYINDNGAQVFMTEDDPATRTFNEAMSRRGDFGKTGTADNGALDPFNDSVFVYRHGRHIIAVWMERADGASVHPAHGMLNQVVSFIEKLEPPRP